MITFLGLIKEGEKNLLKFGRFCRIFCNKCVGKNQKFWILFILLFLLQFGFNSFKNLLWHKGSYNFAAVRPLILEKLSFCAKEIFQINERGWKFGQISKFFVFSFYRRCLVIVTFWAFSILKWSNFMKFL